VPIVLKSGSLNLLEPSGPVKACNGIALPLIFLLSFFEKLQHSLFYLSILLQRHVSNAFMGLSPFSLKVNNP
jgi:hypothetical protein